LFRSPRRRIARPPPFDAQYAGRPYYGEVAAAMPRFAPLLDECAPRRAPRWWSSPAIMAKRSAITAS
jgi:hypothetical protein